MCLCKRDVREENRCQLFIKIRARFFFSIFFSPFFRPPPFGSFIPGGRPLIATFKYCQPAPQTGFPRLNPGTPWTDSQLDRGARTRSHTLTPRTHTHKHTKNFTGLSSLHIFRTFLYRPAALDRARRGHLAQADLHLNVWRFVVEREREKKNAKIQDFLFDLLVQKVFSRPSAVPRFSVTHKILRHNACTYTRWVRMYIAGTERDRMTRNIKGPVNENKTI